MAALCVNYTALRLYVGAAWLCANKQRRRIGELKMQLLCVKRATDWEERKLVLNRDTITALALIEDIVNARFRWEQRLRDCTVVWAHHDDSSNRESKGIRSPLPGAHSHCVQRCASQHLALNRTTFFKVLQLELAVTFCHSTCFILLLKLKLSAGFDKSDKRNMCLLFLCTHISTPE